MHVLYPQAQDWWDSSIRVPGDLANVSVVYFAEITSDPTHAHNVNVCSHVFVQPPPLPRPPPIIAYVKAAVASRSPAHIKRCQAVKHKTVARVNLTCARYIIATKMFE